MLDERREYDESTQRVVDYWNTELPEKFFWIELPEVASYVHRRATGDPNTDWVSHSERFMDEMPKPRTALSLGCGTGIIERIVRKRDICQSIDGYDVADAAIETARNLAIAEGLSGLNYRVADLHTLVLPPDTYDVVYAHAILHHIFYLERLLEQIYNTLKPGGVLVVYEYVGPSQMQFPPEHLKIADALLRLIPERYRHFRRWSGIKNEAPRLSLADMNTTDPSEAIRSAEIVSLIRSRFESLYYRDIGGTLLLLVLNEISGNFESTDPLAISIVGSLIDIEDTLIESESLLSYHAYIVARKPK
jgi:ubiquinone/menaquinone biosynthesis C-methylase UbiE